MAVYIFSTIFFGGVVLILIKLSFKSILSTKSNPKIATPLLVPYKLPYVGHALRILNTSPTDFWQWLAAHQANTGTYTLHLLGLRTYIVCNPQIIEKIFKLQHLDNHFFSFRLARRVLGLSPEESHTFLVKYSGLEQAFRSYLLKPERADELTSIFLDNLRRKLDMTGTHGMHGTPIETHLGCWLDNHVFNASVTTIFGNRLLEVYPDLEKDMTTTLDNTMRLFSGLPWFFFPRAHRARDRVLLNLQKFHSTVMKECNGKLPCPEEAGWGAVIGSRVWRALHAWCDTWGLTPVGRAGMDLGTLMGLSGNAIPACKWMMMHILNPHETLLQRVMDELAVVKLDHGPCVKQITRLPLLQSIYQEVLRLYIDALIIRYIDEQIRIPLDESRYVLFKKGLVAASTWLTHRSTEIFTNQPADMFYADRFTQVDPESGKTAFNASGMVGRLFPFGGGKSMCPGRNFAKQEILCAVASMLLTYEFQFVEYVNEHGRTSGTFPRPMASSISNGVMVASGDMRVNIKYRV